VSSQNDCCFCQLSHGAAAAEHLGGDYDLIDRVKRNYATAEITDKLKSLLAIASKVQQGGKHVTSEDVARARQQGATDKEIHDTVLIAAAFCMFNRTAAQRLGGSDADYELIAGIKQNYEATAIS
jgi:uncharacterized peroxidase-related enzyme